MHTIDVFSHAIERVGTYSCRGRRLPGKYARSTYVAVPRRLCIGEFLVWSSVFLLHSKLNELGS